jgi:hypothetical protein
VSHRAVYACVLVETRNGSTFTMLIDEMDDRVGRAYRAWPTRVYAIDKDGRVAFKNRPGPFGFEAAEIRPGLERALGPAGAKASPS